MVILFKCKIQNNRLYITKKRIGETFMQIKRLTVDTIKKIAAKIVGLFLSAKYQIRQKNHTIDIGQHLASVRRILIYMPDNTEQFKVALNSLGKLSEKVPASKLTLIANTDRIGLIDKRIKVKVLTYSSMDINLLGLPKKSLLQLFENSSYDMALDLNPGFDLLSILLFQHSKAPLKVCFDSREKSPFFNFSIRTNVGQSLQKKYDSLFQYITLPEQSKTKKRPLGSTGQEIN